MVGSAPSNRSKTTSSCASELDRAGTVACSSDRGEARTEAAVLEMEVSVRSRRGCAGADGLSPNPYKRHRLSFAHDESHIQSSLGAADAGVAELRVDRAARGASSFRVREPLVATGRTGPTPSDESDTAERERGNE